VAKGRGKGSAASIRKNKVGWWCQEETAVCRGELLLIVREGLLIGREDYCLSGTACTLSTIFVRVNLLFARKDYHCLAERTTVWQGLHVLFLSGFTMFVRDSYDTSGLSTGNKNTSNPSRCIPPSTPPVQLLTVSEFPANVRVRFAGTVASFSVKYLGKLHAKISDRETRDAWWDDLR
jgi:hypothetical protein